jgi:hypothetical protein
MPATARRALAAALVLSAPLLPGVAPAGAEGAEVPFKQVFRRCDFTSNAYLPATGYGRPSAQVGVDGNTLVADVRFATGVPFTRYDVRAIQVPRTSAAPCNPGDPGVVAGSLSTDGAGNGQLTIRGPLAPGATGVWLSVTRPSANSQQPAEFYSTDYVKQI